MKTFECILTIVNIFSHYFPRTKSKYISHLTYQLFQYMFLRIITPGTIKVVKE